ncbi:MAG: hypothetical protein EPGJADBJ_02577 [Saprospiraceae bacterium]|nr:hypothetical protein [Saprospiraceae bacterium]
MKKQPTLSILILLLTAAPGGFFAQSAPLSDTLQVNSIRARVQSNGAFFLGGTSGEFLVPGTTGAAPALSLMKSAGLWLGGRDNAGNLHLSAQLYNENGKTDFYPGVLGEDGLPYDEFNLIAGVTKAEVNAHIANPAGMIPAVYGWPGRANPFFTNYYNFDLPLNLSSLAGFHDLFGNNHYDPDEGDYPAIDIRGCSQKFGVDEAMWFAFQDAGPHTQSGGLPLLTEIHAQVAGFNCPEGSPADRVVYVAYKIINRDTVVLDSCYFGVFLDFEIGNGGDDFIGCDSARRVVFAYNGDATDEGGFEDTPPVMAVDLLRGPLDPDDPFFQEAPWHFVPVDDSELDSPEKYYRLLAGRRTNGQPFPNNGVMYAGDPLQPSDWSEISDGNTPGERKALASFGPFRLVPGAVNEVILGYTWVRKDPNGSVADNLSIVGATMDVVQEIFDNCFELFEGCPGNVATGEPGAALPVTVSPNPFTGLIRVESEEILMESVLVFDATGRPLRKMTLGGQASATIQTGDLPPGLYILQVRAANGRLAAYKLIHN